LADRLYGLLSDGSDRRIGQAEIETMLKYPLFRDVFAHRAIVGRPTSQAQEHGSPRSLARSQLRLLQLPSHIGEESEAREVLPEKLGLPEAGLGARLILSGSVFAPQLPRSRALQRGAAASSPRV
jgi:hypothetical protein